MISITCTSCQNVLTIDDAFAGGVCRCQHCGTIQTVPARRKDVSVKTAANTSGGKSASGIYKNDSRTAVAAGSGSGLDDLAEVVASSGLSDGQLRKRTATSKPAWKNSPLVLIIAGAIIVLLAVIVVILLMRMKSNTPGAAGPGGSTAAPASAFAPSGPGEVIGDGDHPADSAPKSTGPHCFGVKLSQETVVYLIDNGSSASQSLDYIKAAVFRSVESLGPNHFFRILFWNPETAGYPATSDAAAVMPANLTDARRSLEDTESGGSTDPGASLKKALEVNPGEIVLITTKGYELEDSVLQTVMTIRGKSAVKIHTIAINGAADDSILKKIAEQTGGVFESVSAGQLKAAAE